jgi:hypothetical protein
MNQIAKAFTSCAHRVFRQCLLVNCGLGLPVTDPLNSSPPATSLARSSSSFAFSTYQLALQIHLLPPDLRPSQPPPVTPESSPYIPTCKLSTDFLSFLFFHRLVFASLSCISARVAGGCRVKLCSSTARFLSVLSAVSAQSLMV